MKSRRNLGRFLKDYVIEDIDIVCKLIWKARTYVLIIKIKFKVIFYTDF